MHVKVILYNALYDEDQPDFPEKWNKEFDIGRITTIYDVVELADLSSYYPLSGVFSWNCQYVPYIIEKRKRVQWDVDYKDIKVKDFIYTHNIKDNTIVAKVGYPQAGGPGFKELIEIWEMVYPILDQFVTVVGASAILASAGKWFASLFSTKKPPQTYFDLIFSRKNWNHFELAEVLKIKSEDSKKLLTLFGYKYDNSIMMYVQQPESLVLREKLSEINVHDV